VQGVLIHQFACPIWFQVLALSGDSWVVESDLDD